MCFYACPPAPPVFVVLLCVSSPRPVFVQAFGTNASRAGCKNLAARKVIDAVKKVVEHLNKSSLMKVRSV